MSIYRHNSLIPAVTEVYINSTNYHETFQIHLVGGYNDWVAKHDHTVILGVHVLKNRKQKREGECDLHFQVQNQCSPVS